MAYNQAASRCHAVIKKFHAAKEVELIRKITWVVFLNNFVNRKLHCKNRNSVLRTADGTMTSNSTEKAKIFNKFFASVFTTDDDSVPEVSRRADNTTSLSTITFTQLIVGRTLQHFKHSPSTGLDGIPNLLLKNCASSPLEHR